MKLITNALLLSAALLLPLNANAGLLFFTDRSAFELASGLSEVNEDFEAANVSPGGVAGTNNPLNSFTNDSTFSTGDIIDGLSVSASSGSVVALGAGLIGSSKSVGADLFSATTILSFNAGYQAIGLDLFSSNSDDVIDISIFGLSDSFLQLTTASGINSSLSFFGVISDSDLITKISFDSQNGAGEIIDNIIFLNAVSVPEPAGLAIFSLGLFALRLRQKKVK